MVAILEKSEHNVDFHLILDFVEASPLMYALTFKPTVCVSHIGQFWSTARIEITEEGIKILATVDDILRTVTESSLRRNLKLKYDEGISSLSDAELFENLTLMGYNISPNQKFTFQKGQFSHQWKYLICTIMQFLSPKSTGFNEFSSNIATALVCLATNRVYNFSKINFDGMVKNVNNKVSKFLMYPRRARIAQSSALPPVADKSASPLRDVSQGEACPTISSLDAEQDKANIAKTSTLPHESTSRVPSFAADEGKRSGDDAPIKGRRLDEGEEAAEKGSNDTEEMINVLTSMDVATVLSSGVAEVPTGSGFIPTASPPAAEVPTSSDVVPTAGLIFATATVVTPYIRRKGKEKMIESETSKKKKIQGDAEIARIHAEEELQIMIDGLDRSNEIVAMYLQEYHQFATKLPIERRIELISDLVMYQDNYAKVHKYQTLQRKPRYKKQKKDYYMAIEDFIPIGSKEETERFKRKGLRLEQVSEKKLKTLEEVPEEEKATEEVSKDKVKEMMQLVPVEEIYVEALQVKPLIIDWKHLDREDLNQLWALVKESLSIRPASSDKDIEL
uniref:Synaptobrevin, longin-like domain protein n=1 Tax=Tanacetum cinerariifolium TaxID=118510 RepID=A0A699HLC9_TANCI|nr:synaptobrevin, longin-like domain protein [Tanacetum cinerariifolium]